MLSKRGPGVPVSRNRIDRLFYRVMGLRAISPGIPPREVKIIRCIPTCLIMGSRYNVHTNAQWIYVLIAIIDLHSRYVVNWSLSNTMDAGWCKEVFEQAITNHGKPEILNTDQGSQFTSEDFTQSVLKAGIKLSNGKEGQQMPSPDRHQ